MKITALLASALLAAGSASGANRDPRPTGIYSDMRYVAEGGDVVGMEVFVVSAAGGYRAVVQCAEGVPGDPVVVAARVDGASLSFDVPAERSSMCHGRFTGTLAPDGLRGRFDGEHETRVLRRGKSYWQ